jgi:short-subunit dehydrogenase
MIGLMELEAARVALVTGATSGIGEATALALASEGFAVALAGRRAERLAGVAARIRASGGRAEEILCDLERPGAAAGLVAETIARLGRLDLLVNNAGRGYTGPVENVPEEAARSLFELNLVAPFLLMSAALPHLRATGGLIVNLASAGGLLPSPFFAAYSASKAGLVSLSDSARLEERVLADGPAGTSREPVRIVAICPGPVKTEFASAAGGAPVHADGIGIRVQSSEDIARLIVRQVRRPGRTVPTTLTVRAGALLFRFAPRLFDPLVLSWARRIRPAILQHFQGDRDGGGDAGQAGGASSRG